MDESPAPRPAWTRSSAALDVLIALSFFGLLSLGIVAYTPLLLLGGDEAPPISLSIGLAIAMTAPLAWRRRAPRTVLTIVALSFAAFRVVEGPEWSVSSLALFVTLYTVGAELPPSKSRPPRAVVVVGIAVLVVYVWTVALDADAIELAGRELTMVQIAEGAMNLMFGAAAWVLGDIAWRRRAAEHELSDRLAELTVSRQELALRAVQDERVRIARELHDVVAHHVSVMGIQAGAARRSIERCPEEAGRALTNVEQASRDAVTEMQRLLQFLRRDDDRHESLTPQPSLEQLASLIESVRDTGLTVELQVEGTPRRLPSSVELSAYRIVQEALTNTLKHGDAVTTATVILTYEPDRLRVEVRDDGTSAHRHRANGTVGRGLLGMHERAVLHGGDVEVGTTLEGGFVVRGWLPTRSVGPRPTASA